MKRVSKFLLCAAAAALFQTSTAPVAFADPILGADLFSFAVLGASQVTSVGTVVGGNVGSFPTATTTGVYTFLFGGCPTCAPPTPFLGTVTASQAQDDLTAAILAINAGTADDDIADGDLMAFAATQTGGFIGPGTYDVGALATGNIGVNDTLVLDGGGAENPVWRFRFSSTLITGEGSNLIVQGVGGDGTGAGLYFTAVSGATLDGNTWAGNTFAGAKISTNGGLTISCGRLASSDADVTLDGGGNTVSIGTNCGGFDEGGGENDDKPIPEPGTLALLGSGIAAVVARRRRSARARQQDLAPKA